MSRAILVKSCIKFRNRRAACEGTWAKALREYVPVYFVEGGASPCVLGTLIQTGSGDDYGDNSHKVRDAIRLLMAIEPFESLFVCDDNTFVHPGRWLAHEPAGEFEGLMSDRIPWVHGGAGWWMSRQCCELYVAGVQKRCSWDDTLATNILTGQHKIPMTNRPDLYAQWQERVSADNDLITCHNVEPAEMLTLFEATRDLPTVHNVLSRA